MDEDWEVIGVESGEGAPLRVYGNMGGGYCEVRRGGVAVGRETGGRSQRSEFLRESWISPPICSFGIGGLSIRRDALKSRRR